MAEGTVNLGNNEQSLWVIRFNQRKGRGYSDTGRTDAGGLEWRHLPDDSEPFGDGNCSYCGACSCVCHDPRIHPDDS